MSANEALNALSTTDASNTPAGGDAIGTTLDDELRSIKANIARAARYEVTATVTAAATVPVTALNKVIPMEGSAGGATTITLPTVASAGNGFQLNFFKLGAINPVIIDGNGAETINGAADLTVSSSGRIVQLVCDGTSWYENVIPAATIGYDNAASGLTATNVKAAIDEVDANADTLLALRRGNYGFSIANGTDADHDLNVGAGKVWDSTNAELIEYAAATCVFDAAWGSGGNLDTGALPATGFLYLYATHDASQSNSIVIGSTSATWAGVTKQSGFTKGRRIGVVPTDGSNNIVALTVVGNEVGFSLAQSGGASSGLTTNVMALLTVNFAPPKTKAYGVATMSCSAFQSNLQVAVGPAGATTASTAGYQRSGSQFAGAYASTMFADWTQLLDSSGRLCIGMNNTSGTHTLTLYVHGYNMIDRFEE